MPKKKLHTIGYEGASLDGFIATLQLTGIDLLIDVREVPVSRKKGFSKNSLSRHLADVGIDYLHLKGLGDPKPGRVAARAGQYAKFRRIFNAHMKTELARNDLGRAIEVAHARAACLLCFERDHTCCHRRIVANEMARLAGFELHHHGISPQPHVHVLSKRQGTKNEALGFVR